MRLEGGGNHGVLPGRKFEAVAHLSGVDEGAAHGHSSLSQQDVRTEVDVAAALELEMSSKWRTCLRPNSLHSFTR